MKRDFAELLERAISKMYAQYDVLGQKGFYTGEFDRLEILDLLNADRRAVFDYLAALPKQKRYA